MHRSVIDEEFLRAKALHISGLPSQRRPRNPSIESAIRDARAFLESVPTTAPSAPHVSSGTTAALETILTAWWLVAAAHGMRTIQIDFFGMDKCSARWSSPDGTNFAHENITIEEAINIDLPQKVQIMRNALCSLESPALQ